ncbi:MAG: alanine--tRNA ligase [Proteobacteria bacterium]|nr:alanine--tRNA ligase [Pseudomonadota bacterium]
MTGAEIRQKFLDYFTENDHRVVKSSSLLPAADPSLLFTNAGMVQFKNVFLGQEKRDYVRAATCQKCVRAGGKHNDLENVGITSRHHTFFEMLGNFSFGDYFKAKACYYGWDLLVNGYGLDPERLWVTIFEDDDEAEKVWQSEVGVRPERIVRLGEKDNFWAMGEIGPCGPCSEIHFDRGPEAGCDRPDCAVGCDCDRYLEVWNLVFMQYERDHTGKMTPLPRPSIDTGMGLERISTVVQGVLANYDTDLFQPIIQSICELSGVAYGQGEATDMALRVIADHARATAFLIGDGILPENVGRGYVLRRILRRAVRYGRVLGLTRPFVHQVSAGVIDLMKDAYPDLADAGPFVSRVIENEERRFSDTLDYGLKLLDDEIARLEDKGERVIPGEVVFKLYDTYGFPADLVDDIAVEHDLSVDVPGFKAAMAAQKERARAAWKGSGEEAVAAAHQALIADGVKSEFVGYETVQARGKVLAVIKDGQRVDSAVESDAVEVVTDVTPFYGRAGGQVGDVGSIRSDEVGVQVTDTLKVGELIVHQGTVTRGTLTKDLTMDLEVDAEKRSATAANHTATHLLHRALRQTLGDHVKQAGSLVAPDRLRFDFTHFAAVDRAALDDIERQVNAEIRADRPVTTTVMPMDEAIKTGAMALFEERYGDEVRLVEVEGFSKELCGGTHLSRTGQAGFFVILSEGSVAAGVRRIEALAGAPAVAAAQAQRAMLVNAADSLRVKPEELTDRLARLQAQVKDLEKEAERLQNKLASGGDVDVMEQVRDVAGVKVLAAKVRAADPKALRAAGDRLRVRLASGIIVLGAESNGKAMLLSMVSPDLTDRFNAGDIIKAAAAPVGGQGGGRPDMAQAGGPEASKLDEALAAVRNFVEKA